VRPRPAAAMRRPPARKSEKNSAQVESNDAIEVLLSQMQHGFPRVDARRRDQNIQRGQGVDLRHRPSAVAADGRRRRQCLHICHNGGGRTLRSVDRYQACAQQDRRCSRAIQPATSARSPFVGAGNCADILPVSMVFRSTKRAPIASFLPNTIRRSLVRSGRSADT